MEGEISMASNFTVSCNTRLLNGTFFPNVPCLDSRVLCCFPLMLSGVLRDGVVRKKKSRLFVSTSTVHTAAITVLGSQDVQSLKCCCYQWVLVSATVSPPTRRSEHVADNPPDRVDVSHAWNGACGSVFL